MKQNKLELYKIRKLGLDLIDLSYTYEQIEAENFENAEEIKLQTIEKFEELLPKETQEVELCIEELETLNKGGTIDLLEDLKGRVTIKLKGIVDEVEK